MDPFRLHAPARICEALALNFVRHRQFAADGFGLTRDRLQLLLHRRRGSGVLRSGFGRWRRAAMDAAGGIIGQLIRPSFGDEAVTVRVRTYSDTTNNILASADAAFFYSGFATSDPRYQSGTQYPKALASHYLKADIEPDHDDIDMNVNLGQPFYWGTDAATPGNQYDFVSVAMHELIHGLGFLDSFRQQGGYGLFGDGTYDSEDDVSGSAVAYDRFVTVGAGGSSLLSLNSNSRVAALIGNNLYWGVQTASPAMAA